MESVFQTVFRLSLASNAIAELRGTTPELQAKAEELIPQRILATVGPQWEIVWGPVVWQHPGAKPDDVPDNVWYVARSPNVLFEDGRVFPTYVIAIAGTAGGLEDYDWVQEDSNVDTVVDLKSWVNGPGGITTKPFPRPPSGPDQVLVANGTTQAVFTLANTPPPPSARGAGLPLYEFMRKISNEVESHARFVFTGLSLGAALSPTLAVTLKEAGYLKQDDPSNQVRVYPIAGASPGNENFVDLYKRYFPGLGEVDTPFVWNLNIVNLIDLVPQGWCTDPTLEPQQNLTRLPTMYGNLPPLLNTFVRISVRQMTDLANLSHTIYRPLPISAFSGDMPETPKTIEEFMNTALSQHLDPYLDFILSSPQERMAVSTTAVATKSGAIAALGDNAYLLFPVIRDLWRINLQAQRSE